MTALVGRGAHSDKPAVRESLKSHHKHSAAGMCMQGRTVLWSN